MDQPIQLLRVLGSKHGVLVAALRSYAAGARATLTALGGDAPALPEAIGGPSVKAAVCS